MGDEQSNKSHTDAESAASLVEAANNLENLSQEELQELLQESRIVIKPGGQVVIENLTADLLEVAYELDPDNPGIQCRVPGEDGAPDEAESGLGAKEASELQDRVPDDMDPDDVEPDDSSAPGQ